jgi:signal transduction histidine kinase
MIARLARLWTKLSLARRFALAAAPVLLLFAGFLGFWVSGRVADGVIRHSAATTALYLDGIIAPLNDELASDEPPPPVILRALDEIFKRPDIAGRIRSVRLWRPDGLLIYATEPGLTGKVWPVSDDLAAAFAGEVTGEYGSVGDHAGALPSPDGSDLIEVYAPIREAWSGRIIAAVEVYQAGGNLGADLARTRAETWAVVAVSALLLGAALFRIVWRGSRTIKLQEDALRERLTLMENMAQSNTALRLRVQSAAGRAVSLNEKYLRRVGSDLHDGPAQNLAVAKLRLPRLAGIESKAAREAEAAEIAGVLDAAMHEIRTISRGLTLPELEGLALADLLDRAVEAHRQRSRTEVALDREGIGGLILSHPGNICAWRFVQEGLSNALRHAGGKGQRVAARSDGQALTLTVADDGGGGDVRDPSEEGGLGLAGLRERIESLGGQFSRRQSGSGTVISMSIPLEDS